MFIRKRTRGNGTRWSVVYVDDHGKRHETVAGSTRKAAEMLKVRLERERAEGILGKPTREDPTFQEFSEIFLRAWKERVKPSTYDDISRSMKNHIVPYFKDLRLSGIGPADVSGFLSYLREKGLAPGTRGKIFRHLKAVFRYGLSLEITQRDSSRVVTAPRVERDEPRFLSDAEVRILLEAADSDLRPLLAVACYAGLRQGEILGLKWGDVSFESSSLRVSRSYHHAYGITTPKTPSSRRTVPMIPTLRGILEDHYLASGKPSPGEPVFPAPAGGHMDRRRLIDRFQRALAGAALEGVKFHDLRHSFAALMVESGCDPKTLQSIMGHASIQVTLDIYGHLYSTAYERAARGLENLISGGPKVVPLRGAREAK